MSHVEHAIGSAARPLSDHDLEAKFRGLTADILSLREIDHLLDLCWRVEELPDLSELTRATVPSSTAR